MDKIDSVTNFLSEKNLKNVSYQIEKITDLYLKPVKVWKKILSNEKSSIGLFVFYLIIFGLVLYIFSPNLLSVVKIILIHLIAHLQPFLLTTIPFLFFTWLYNKKIKIDRLFRITFIYSLQTFPLIFFPMLVAEKFGVEFPYIISENATAITDILLVAVVPLLINVSLWKKIIWILTNYIFLLVFCYIQSYILQKNPEIKLVQDEIEYISPMKEFLEFEAKYKDSDLFMSDRFFLFYYKKTETQKKAYPQFCSLPLLDKIVKSQDEMLKDAKSKTDRLLYENDTTGAVLKEIKFETFTSDKFKIRVKFDKKDFFPKATLDSFRHSYNKIYLADLKLTDSFMKHARFKENRKLFKLYNQNLNLFDSIYTSEKFVQRMIYETGYYTKINVNDGGHIYLYEYSASIKNNFIRLQKKNLIRQNDKILNNFENYIFLKKYLYFPFFYFGKKEPFENQFKYITVK